MNVIDYLSLQNAYNAITTILKKNIDCGDEDEAKHINNLKLGEIVSFLSSVGVKKCPACNGKGIVYYSLSGTEVEHDEGTKTCPNCNGSGGYFIVDDIECTL